MWEYGIPRFHFFPFPVLVMTGIRSVTQLCLEQPSGKHHRVLPGRCHEGLHLPLWQDHSGSSGSHNDWEADRQGPLLFPCLGKTGINIKSLERGDLNAKQHPPSSCWQDYSFPSGQALSYQQFSPFIYTHSLTHTGTGSHYQTMIEWSKTKNHAYLFLPCWYFKNKNQFNLCIIYRKCFQLNRSTQGLER